MGLLLGILPDWLLPVAVTGVGFLVMLGLLRIGRAMQLIGAILLAVLFGPFIAGILSGLPGWVSVAILALLGLSLLRALAELLIGQRAAATMTGTLAADLVRLGVRVLMLPLLLLGLLARIIHEST